MNMYSPLSTKQIFPFTRGYRTFTYPEKQYKIKKRKTSLRVSKTNPESRETLLTCIFRKQGEENHPPSSVTAEPQTGFLIIDQNGHNSSISTPFNCFRHAQDGNKVCVVLLSSKITNWSKTVQKLRSDTLDL